MSETLVVGLLTDGGDHGPVETALADVFADLQVVEAAAAVPDGGVDCLVAFDPLPADLGERVGNWRNGDGDLPLVVLGTPGREARVRDIAAEADAADLLVDASQDRYRRLADRVRGVVAQRRRHEAGATDGTDVADASGAGGSTAGPGTYVRDLYEVATDATLSFEAKAQRILEVGVERLDVENAHLSTIEREPDHYEILASVGELPMAPGDLMDLPETFCRKTVESDEVLAINHASDQGWEGDPAYERGGVECYLGSRITVGGSLYGTVCFLDRNPHDAFTEGERTFVSLVARWLSHELERTRRESALDALHTATTDLMRASTRTEVCERVGAAAGEVADTPDARVWLADEAEQTLRVMAGPEPSGTGGVVPRDGDIGGDLWRAIETGTVQHWATAPTVDERPTPPSETSGGPADRWAGDDAPPGSVVVTPLGTEGVLEVMAESPDAFDDIDVSMLRMLASSGAAALDRAERREELAAARQRFQRIFESANDALLLVDPAGEEIVECNDRACELLGYDRETLLATAPSSLHATVEEYHAFVQEVQSTGQGWTDALTMRRADGRQFPVEVSAAIVELPERTRLLASVRDVSQRRLREQALAVFNRVLRHNIRNDMNVIVGQAELLEHSLSDPDLQSQVGQIVDMGEDLLALGEKARLFQKLDDHADDVRTLDIHEAIERVAAVLREEYPAATIEVEGPRTMAKVDTTIDVAFRELLENAVVHADSEAPTVTVTIGATHSDDQFAVTITDDGPGLPEQDLSVLEETVETPLQHGSGLGLWIATWIVERNGGAISVPETGPDGTSIRLVLPTAAAADAESAGQLGSDEELDAA